MFKDQTGNELKMGDKVVLPVGGVVVGVITELREGGIVQVDPRNPRQTVEVPGSAIITVEFPVQFDPRKNATCFKYIPLDDLKTQENGPIN